MKQEKEKKEKEREKKKKRDDEKRIDAMRSRWQTQRREG